MINKGLIYNKGLVKSKEAKDLCKELENIYKECTEQQYSCKGLESTMNHWKCNFVKKTALNDKNTK